MVQIRQGTLKDVMAVGKLQQEMLLAHLQLDSSYKQSSEAYEEWTRWLKEKCSDPHFVFFVVENELTIIGYITGWIALRPPIYEQQKYGYLSNIFINPAFQEKGVGKLLINTFCDWFVSKGIPYVELSVDIKNSRATTAFTSTGFHVVRSEMRRDLL